MRRFRVRLGSLLGIPLWIHASWVLVLGLAVWASTNAFAEALPRLPLAERLAMASATGIAFFGCLAVHEVAHALVARRFGVRVHGITLFLLGGVAEIEGEIPSPGAEFAVALVGPAASIVLGSAFLLLADRLGSWVGGQAVAFTLAAVNLGVAVFNLIPGLPLDGGRVLRAVLWRRSGSFVRATRIASRGGAIVAALLAVMGLVIATRGDAIGLWYVLMGAFIWTLARASGRASPPVERRGLALTGEGEAS